MTYPVCVVRVEMHARRIDRRRARSRSAEGVWAQRAAKSMDTVPSRPADADFRAGPHALVPNDFDRLTNKPRIRYERA